MIQAPEPLKRLLDTFPLKKFPATPNITVSNKKFVESNKYYFEFSENHCDTQKNACFTIGVHNVIEIITSRKKVVVPSDPVSLGFALILCHKNELRLPSSESGQRSENAIMKMSYSASPDNNLPILIEDEKEIRNIRSIHSMNQSLITKNLGQDPESFLVNDLIDNKLLDIWISCILCENLSNEIICNIFHINEELVANNAITSFASIDILRKVPHWNFFKSRHPNLFKEGNKVKVPTNIFNRTIFQIVTNTNSNLINAFYKDQLNSLKEDLGLIINYINITKSNESKLILLKLAGYFISIDITLKGTKLEGIISEHSDFLKVCYSILESY